MSRCVYRYNLYFCIPFTFCIYLIKGFFMKCVLNVVLSIWKNIKKYWWISICMWINFVCICGYVPSSFNISSHPSVVHLQMMIIVFPRYILKRAPSVWLIQPYDMELWSKDLLITQTTPSLFIDLHFINFLSLSLFFAHIQF